MNAKVKLFLIITTCGNLMAQEQSALEDASVEIIRLHFNQKSQVLVREDGNDSIIKDIADRVVQRIEKEYMIPMEINDDQFRDFFCKVYFLDSADQILRHDKPGAHTFSSFCPKRLVVLKIKNVSLNYYDEMELLLESVFFVNSRVHSDVLIEPTEGNIFLYTFDLYQENSCERSHAPIKIDKFDVLKGEFERPSVHFSDKKLQNFHSCPLKVGVGAHYPPFLFEKKGKLTGMEWDMMNLLAETLKFQIKVEYKEPQVFDWNMFQLLIDKKLDVSLGYHVINTKLSEMFSLSQPHYQTSIVFFASRLLEIRTPLEKFLLPFKVEVWYMIAGLMLSWNIVFIILNSIPGILDSNNGQYIYASYLVMLGSPINIFKFKTTFSRILGMVFMLSFVITRTAYVGKLYGNFNTNSGIQFDDYTHAFQRGYVPFISKFMLPFLDRMPDITEKAVVNNEPTIEKALDSSIKTKGKYLMACPRRMLLFFRKDDYNYWKFYILKDSIFHQHLTLYFQFNSAISETFGQTISLLKAYGLIDKIDSKYVGNMLSRRFPRPTQMTPIAMTNLEVEFLIWISMCLLSTAFFVVELLSQNVKCLARIIVIVNEY
ncbi:hypothetical protein ACFFRR_001521 [Megaselia abdita]